MITCRKRLVLTVLLLALAACSSGLVPPLLLGSGQLEYPTQALQARLEGTVQIRYDVSATGEVENPAVVSSEPSQVFDAAALAFVRSWKFQPQTRDGIAERVIGMESTIQFSLSARESIYTPYLRE